MPKTMKDINITTLRDAGILQKRGATELGKRSQTPGRGISTKGLRLKTSSVRQLEKKLDNGNHSRRKKVWYDLSEKRKHSDFPKSFYLRSICK